VATIKINFEWSRAFPKAAGESAYEFADGKIWKIGRGVQRYFPLENEQLFLEFAQLDSSPTACVAFAERFGFLQWPARSHPPARFEELNFWQREIKRMMALIRALPTVVRVANSRGTYARVGKIDVLLVPGSGLNSKPVLVMEPGNLLEAMNLQLAQFVAGGNPLLTCQECHQFFAAGRGAKRTISRFCKTECRNKYHNARRGGK
jgi:hypothetical protein